jgi:hypothetical protein
MDWDLIGWSFRVIRRNKQLALFPAFSAAAALVAIWLCSAWRFGSVQALVGRRSFTGEDYALLAPVLFLVSFLIIFFNCALAACANAELSGRPATFGDGLRQAAARLGPIFGWALLSTTVVLVLRSLERRAVILGKLAVWIFGFAWAMATYLVIPVLIAEDHGALESVRRSAQIAKETWGDQIVAEIRWGWRGLLLFLPSILLFVVGLNGYPLALPFAVVCFLVTASVMTAAHGVFEVALYRYAALRETPDDWSQAIVNRIVR